MARRNNGTRSGEHFKFGHRSVHLISKILPSRIAATAAATCRFELQGKFANGNDWGLGFRTYMQTFGEMPEGVNKPGQPQCYRFSRDWISLNSINGAAIVLNCYGISLVELWEWVIKPGPYERKKFDLMEVVNALRPNLFAD